MKSSTNRALVAKKQSTSFAQVATNLLNVLQGYSKTIRLLLVMFLTLTISAEVWAETATFTANSYGWTNSTLTGDPTTKTIGDVTFKFAGGSTKPTYYTADGLRTYEGCKITISSEATISSIAFTYKISNSGSLSATPGTWDSSKKKWSGSANTVTFTVGHSSGTKNGQIRITQIVVTYTAAASCSSQVTITKASATGGSFKVHQGTASGTEISSGGKIDNCDANAEVVVVPTADANYTCTGVTATNSNSISGPNGDGNYTITYTKDSNISSKITVSFTENQKYTVTWMVDKDELSTEDVYENGKVSSVPTVTELPCGDKFVGWTTDPITTPQDNAPTVVFTTVDGSPKIIEPTTFYAVFADYKD